MLRPLRLRRQLRALALAAVFGFCAASGSSSAFAQSEQELAEARSLYREGLSLEAAGDWASALSKFEQVAKVKLTAQVRFHIARCKEQLGRLNEALGEYRLAEYEATQQSAKELPEITQAREALEARIPKLVITRGKGAKNARVQLDGVELGESKLGNEVSVDPGPHRVVGRLPNGGEFEESVTLAEGEIKTLELVPPEDPDELIHRNKRNDRDSLPSDVATSLPPKSESTSSALPWIIGGVGVASLAASGVFFVLRNGAESDLEDGCRGDVCPERLRDTEDKGKTYATLTSVTLGVGVVGIGVAAVLLMSGDSSSEASAAEGVRVDVQTAGGFSGVNVGGRF